MEMEQPTGCKKKEAVEKLARTYNLMAYLLGLFGMYCLKLHIPLNPWRDSSTVQQILGIENGGVLYEVRFMWLWKVACNSVNGLLKYTVEYITSFFITTEFMKIMRNEKWSNWIRNKACSQLISMLRFVSLNIPVSTRRYCW